MNKRILIYDPVPFKGGSKEVMKTIINELPNDVEAWVISNDHQSWQHSKVHFMPLFSPQCLINQTSGILYFVKHFVYLISLMSSMYQLKRFNKVIGISGPCVDFALYLLTELIVIDVIQLIQGKVANSRIAAFGLNRAKQVFYLPAAYDSIKQVLYDHGQHSSLNKERFTPFINGIDSSTIKAKSHNKTVAFLWAASLLKWKRLELFVQAMAKLNKKLPKHLPYQANVCYIEPTGSPEIDLVKLKTVENIKWYVEPNNLNDIRANSSIFISTAEQEPFGLSILESMTAGLAIVIPADNAYWDQQLIDGYNCMKYIPNNIDSLVNTLTKLLRSPKLRSSIAFRAQQSAQNYDHHKCYANIVKKLPN